MNDKPKPAGTRQQKRANNKSVVKKVKKAVRNEIRNDIGNSRRPKKQAKRNTKRSVRSFIKRMLPSGLGMLGSLYGPGAAAIGSAVGRMAGNVMGSGELVIPDQRAHGALVRGGNDAGEGHKTIITRSELVKSYNIVNTSGSPIVNQDIYFHNPSDPSTFPWLSNLAALYERFTFIDLYYSFDSNTAAFNGQGYGLGQLFGNNFYDVSQTVPTTKTDLKARDQCTEFADTISFDHGVECIPETASINIGGKKGRRKTTLRPHQLNGGSTAGPMFPNYLIKDGNNSSKDPMFLYPSKSAFTGFLPDKTALIGELTINYTIELINPQNPDGGAGGNAKSDYFVSIAGTGSSFSSSVPCGPNPTLVSGSTLNGTLTSAGVYTFPRGARGLYNLQYFWNLPGSTGNCAFPTLNYSGCAVNNMYAQGNGNYFGVACFPAVSTSANQMVGMVNVNVTSDNATITIASIGFPATAGSNYGFTLIVDQVASLLLQTPSNNSVKTREDLLKQAVSLLPTHDLEVLVKGLSKLRRAKKDNASKPCIIEECKSESSVDSWLE